MAGPLVQLFPGRVVASSQDGSQAPALMSPASKHNSERIMFKQISRKYSQAPGETKTHPAVQRQDNPGTRVSPGSPGLLSARLQAGSGGRELGSRG